MKLNRIVIIIFFSSVSIFSYAESFINENSSFFSSEENVINNTNSFTNIDDNVLSNGSAFLNEKNTFLYSNSNFADTDTLSIGTYNIVVSKSTLDTDEETEAAILQNTMVDSYINNYDAFLLAVIDNNSASRQKFLQYFSDWQWSGQNESFFAYSKNRAEREQEIARCYKAATAKFGVGTSIIATVWVISWAVPGGQIVSTALLVIAKTTTFAALSGSVLDGITAAGVAYLQGKRDQELLYATINGASDGYLMGAITGLAAGTFNAVRTFHGAKLIKGNIYTKKGRVLDKNGKTIGKVIRFEGTGEKIDDIYYVGKNSTTVFDKSGKEVAKIAKHNYKGKDVFVLYNDKGRILGYLQEGKLVTYCDESPTVALIKGQSRPCLSTSTIEEVKTIAVSKGQYNRKTGNFLDAIDYSEIVGTPEMGHKRGHEYINELQRSFAKGESEDIFRRKMNDPKIYQLESVGGNRSHMREGYRVTIDRGLPGKVIKTGIEKKLWKTL